MGLTYRSFFVVHFIIVKHKNRYLSGINRWYAYATANTIPG
jgi:hypothetical protein